MGCGRGLTYTEEKQLERDGGGGREGREVGRGVVVVDSRKIRKRETGARHAHRGRWRDRAEGRTSL